MKLAGHIEVRRTPTDQWVLTIDGEEFPWYVAADGVSTTVGENELPGLTLTIVAERVTIEHAIK